MVKSKKLKERVGKLICLLPPVIVFLSMMILFKTNGLYPFGEKTLSWCDMDQQVVPLLLDFKDILAGKEGFFFSFKNAGGMNFFGVFFFFLSSPFSFLVAFVDKSDISSFANVLIMLKMCATAFTASLYFFKNSPGSRLLNIVLAVLYAYSGYTMMYYQNLIWLDMAYIFPVLLLSLDRLKEGKRGFFTGALVVCLFINYYISYMIVVFLLLYAFVWSIISKDKKFAGNFVLCCAVAAFISAVVWLPSFVQYFSSGRKTSIVDNLKNSSVFTSYQTTFPTVFSVLFLFPFIFSRKKTQDNKLRFVLFLLTLIPVVFEPINKMWQTGSYMSFPTRYSFITIFLCLTLAADCMRSPESVFETELPTAQEGKSRRFFNDRLSVYAVSILLVVLAVGYLFFAINYTKANIKDMDQYSTSLWGNQQSFEALLKLYAIAFAFGTLCFVLYRFRLLKPVCLWMSVALLVLSELYVAPCTYMLSPSHDVNWYREIVDLSDRIDDEGFYRVKTDREYSGRDFDVNMMGRIGYNALGHYTSLTSGNYMTAIKRFGYTSYWMEVGNSGGTILSDALMSVGYTISDKKAEGDVYRNNYYAIAKNPWYLPLGIVADKDIIKASEDGADYTRRAEFQKTLYEDFFGQNDAVTVYTLDDAELSGITAETLENGKYRLSPSDSSAKITFSVPVAEEEILYFNAFDENTNALNQAINKKFSVSAPGYSISEFPTQKNNGTLKLGEYSSRVVSVTVKIKSDVTVRDFSVFGIKKEKLSAAIKSTETINLQAGKNSLQGKRTAEDGECVFLSVAYNDGLTAKINGKKVKLHEVYGGFTAFYLQKGENDIRITFRPKGFVPGGVFCLVGIAVCAGACIYARRKKSAFALPEILDKSCYCALLFVGCVVVAVIYIVPLLLCAL